MALTAAQKQKAYRERQRQQKALPSVTKTIQPQKNADFSSESNAITHLKPLPDSNPDLDLQRQVEEIFPELKEVEQDFSKCQPEKTLSPAWCGCDYCKTQAKANLMIWNYYYKLQTENNLLKLEIERLTQKLNKKR